MALPEGLTPKTVTVGIPTKFNGTPATGSATLTAPKNLVHVPTGTPLFSGSVTKQFKGLSEVEFTDLVATDADGLNRVDWTYTLTVRVNGAVEQPEPITFVIPDAGPDTIDAELLVEVPSSAGTPVSALVATLVGPNTWTGDQDFTGAAVTGLTAAPAGSAGGALSGTYPNPGLNTTAVDTSVAARVNDATSATASALRAASVAAVLDSGQFARSDETPTIEEMIVSVTSTGTLVAGVQPVFVAPFPLTLKALHLSYASASTGTEIPSEDTNYWTVSLERYRAAVAVTIAARGTRNNSGLNAAWPRRVDWNFDNVAWDPSYSVCQPGDLVAVRFAAGGTPVNPQNVVMTIRYEPI